MAACIPTGIARALAERPVPEDNRQICEGPRERSGSAWLLLSSPSLLPGRELFRPVVSLPSSPAHSWLRRVWRSPSRSRSLDLRHPGFVGWTSMPGWD